MGQKPSVLGGKKTKKLPILWILKRQQSTTTTNPEQPIKFQYKTKRKKQPEQIYSTNTNIKRDEAVKPQNLPLRTKSEPSLAPEKIKKGTDVEEKATIDKPANIPVVLAFSTILYQTRMGGFQSEIQLPLGMVVNAVFKNQNWLYVQTPHAEEGYVNYAACLPLGIIPPPTDSPVPCWENNTDVFPKPLGNMTDTEKLSSRSECSVSRCHSSRSRNAYSVCEEKSVDKLYLQAAACAKIKGTKQTLLVVYCDYKGKSENSLSVCKGDVVVLVSSHLKGWFWVRNKLGSEGFIPSAVAGHGYL